MKLNHKTGAGRIKPGRVVPNKGGHQSFTPYPARRECGCGRSLPDRSTGDCIKCGHPLPAGR